MSVTMRTSMALVATLLVAGAALGSPVPQAKGPSPEEMAELKALCKERVEALQEAYRVKWEEYKAGRATLQVVLELRKELGKAEVDLEEKPEDRITILGNNVKMLKEVEDATKEKFDGGRVTYGDVQMSKAARLEAEIALQRERMKAKAPPK
jgi:outer membrane protein TolC